MCLFPLVQPWKASHCLEGWLLLLLFSCPVVSDPLWSHGLQHVRLLSPSSLHHLREFAQIPVQRVSDAIQPSHPLSPPFSCPQSFPASGSFPVSQLFESICQNIAGSASATVLLMNIQGWFPLGLTSWISLQSQELLRVFSSTTVRKCLRFGIQPSLWSNSHIHTWLLEKPQLWLYGPLLAEWCLCFLIDCLGLL